MGTNALGTRPKLGRAVFLKSVGIVAGVLCSGLTLSGCAPGLGSQFKVGTVETVQERPAENLTGVRVRMQPFTDARSSPVVVVIDGRELEADEDAAKAARRIVEAQFKESGLRAGLFEGAQVRGELLEWAMTVTPGFPSTRMRASARVRLEILPSGDAGVAPIYGARYSAVVEEEHPIGSTDRLERVFARAMAQAASEALADPRFVSELRGRSS